MNNRKTGRVGENIAERYLSKKQYDVLEKNWVIYGGEIDLVTFHKTRKLVFMEVKYSRRANLIPPETLFTKRKQNTLLRSINIYLQNNYYNGKWHVDLICISGIIPDIQLKHYKDVLIGT